MAHEVGARVERRILGAGGDAEATLLPVAVPRLHLRRKPFQPEQLRHGEPVVALGAVEEATVAADMHVRDIGRPPLPVAQDDEALAAEIGEELVDAALILLLQAEDGGFAAHGIASAEPRLVMLEER